jgi:hypothetical protein
VVVLILEDRHLSHHDCCNVLHDLLPLLRKLHLLI